MHDRAWVNQARGRQKTVPAEYIGWRTHGRRYGHHQTHQEGRAWRPSWRRLESRLCRLRDRHDGVLPSDVADQHHHAGTEARHRRLFRAPIHRPDRIGLGRRLGRQGDGRGIGPCRRRPVGDAETIAALARLAGEIAGQRRHRRRHRRKPDPTAITNDTRHRTANSPMPPKPSARRSRTIPISPISPIR